MNCTCLIYNQRYNQPIVALIIALIVDQTYTIPMGDLTKWSQMVGVSMVGMGLYVIWHRTILIGETCIIFLCLLVL